MGVPHPQDLLIIGASARAAAFSAVRAGLRPWCIDLFADADLRALGRCRQVPASLFPGGIMALTEAAPPCPWLYTGAMENRPWLVRQLSERRPLWGNNADVLRRARSPRFLRQACRLAGIPCPDICFRQEQVPTAATWLVKPRRSGGGAGIGFWQGDPSGSHRPVFFQQFIDGEACSAVYVGDVTTARLLGVTWQLVGETWLHAAPFHYCGSIGPMPLADRLRQAFEHLGNALAAACGLRGLFGVDCVLRDGIPWLIEVNPRYTASVEVLERATGLSALAWHQAVFDAPAKESPLDPPDPSPAVFVGKAILFAAQPIVFPATGPWQDALRQPFTPAIPPDYADIPCIGEAIPRGRPVLSLFASAPSMDACRSELRLLASALDLK
jgi:uncharacterized protein